MTTKEIDEVIEKIPEMTFHNLSHKNYYGLTEKYIVSVHPFAVHIYEIKKQINNFNNFIVDINFGSENYIKLIINCHTSDYINNIYSFNPCEIYEIVSGYNSFRDIKVESNEYWSNNIEKFTKNLISYNRKEKIININRSI